MREPFGARADLWFPFTLFEQLDDTMCGICGLIYRDPRRHPDASLLREMASTIRHRGPDDEGVEILGSVGLAHRRLSIIDLSRSGRQPMSNEDGTLWIVFNGEVYNFKELREQLKQPHQFRSATDTEVLLHLYEEQGEAMFDVLDGMFALCIVDLKNQQVLMARDPFGIKPLHYSLDASRLVFGSEIKPLLASGEVARDLDHGALNDYFDFNWIPAPRSIFSQVRKLPPAHTLVLDLKTWESRLRRYWQPTYAPRDGNSLDAWAEEAEHQIQQMVRRQMVSDVPLGTFLSGGIDSTLVTHYAAGAKAGPLKTFTIDFAEAGFSEAACARQVSEALGTDAVFRSLPPKSIDRLPALTQYYDEPFADPSLLPTSDVSRLAREHVTVALSGDGGDELFSGYDHHLLAAKFGPLDAIPDAINRAVFGTIAALTPADWRANDWGRRLALPSDERRLAMMRLPGRGVRTSVLSAELREPIAERAWCVQQHLAELKGLPAITQSQFWDLLFYLPNAMLVKVDRASMACGLEIRVPLLSRSVADLAFQIPESIRFQPKMAKPVLRRLVERHYGRELAYRSKQGFGIPLQSWMVQVLSDALERRLIEGPAVREGPLCADGVRKLFSSVRHRPSRMHTDRSDELFALLMFDAWWNRYML